MDEFRPWAGKAGDAAPNVLAVAESMDDVNQALTSALEKLSVRARDANSALA